MHLITVHQDLAYRRHVRRGHCSAADAYALGLLINGVFNPSNHPPPTANPPHPPPTAASRGAIPAPIFPLVKNLLNPNGKSRHSPQRFLDAGMADAGFFSTNPIVRVCVGLDNFAIGSEAEKGTLLRYVPLRYFSSLSSNPA